MSTRFEHTRCCVDFDLRGKGFSGCVTLDSCHCGVADDVTSLCPVSYQNTFIIFPFKQ